jgi:uncharacterized protein (DUF488 family)
MAEAKSWDGVRIHTIGHSTRPLEELVALLRAFDVSVLADVRTIPRSRKNPQFNAETLPSALAGRGIRHVHLPELGGLRRPRKDSPNAGWRNSSFRGFADHMLCAEAVPWRCHRSLIADAVTARGGHVEHIASAKSASPHRLTPFAKIEGTRVTYPEAASDE